MKKQWLIALMLFGCTTVSKMDTLEDVIYEKNDVYVELDEAEMKEKLSIQTSDYQNKLTLKTLLVMNQKEIYVFEGASDQLKANLTSYCEKGERKDVDMFSICIIEKDDDLMQRIVNHLNTK